MIKKYFAISLFLCSCLALVGQTLTVSVQATDNTDCIGRNCFYNGPTILINEVMLAPANYDGSMAGSPYHTTGGGEWIELYNPHKCDPVDISCYFLGNNAYDNTYQYGNWGGGFVLPQGTVIPPQGFCMVRGEMAPAVPSNLLVQNGGNVVEVVVNSRYCYDTGGGRLWFPNAGGWFAFYDQNGVPQDGISWCALEADVSASHPCLPSTECGFSGTLPSYDGIPAARKNYITSLNPQNYLGQSFRRVPDGGAWQSTPAAPTYAFCNDTCIPPAEASCNATAVATVSGGTPPYSYLWNDNARQTTATAYALCAGTYTVIVTDANMQTDSAQVTVVDFLPNVTHPNYTNCVNDLSVTLQGQPAGGTYSSSDIVNNVFDFHNEVGTFEFTYSVMDTNGCGSSADFSITVNPTSETDLYDTICQYTSYQLYDFNITENEDVGNFVYAQHLQNWVGCDSTVRLHLAVTGSPQVEFLADPDRVMQNDEVHFTNLTDASQVYDNEAFTWRWEFGDNSENSAAALTASHVYDSWGEYLVTLSVASSFGCENSISHLVYVDAELVFPNVLTPNGDNINDVFAIENLNPERPNLLSIYDRWGRKVYEQKDYQTYMKGGVLYNADKGFNPEHFTDGVYYYVFHYEGYSGEVNYQSSLTVIR